MSLWSKNRGILKYGNIQSKPCYTPYIIFNNKPQHPMKEQIIQCLNLSLVPNSDTIKLATNKLAEYSKQPNYCLVMMEVGDDQTQNVAIRQAALIQFKNVVRKYWSAKDNQISVAEKKAILDVLLQAFLRTSTSYPLLKLYKQIVTIIVGHVYKSWLPLQQICTKLQTDANPVPILHFIIAIESNFELSIHDEQRLAFYSFLNVILPCLFTLVQKNTNQEVIYLIMKVLWKIVHYEVSNQIRNSLCQWMDLVLSVAGASNPQLESILDQIQNRGSVQFFYFHAKKWATRILYRFIYRHANPSGHLLATEEVKQQNKEFSKRWYEVYGSRVVEVIVKQFLIPSIKKTRFFQLKCLTGLINHHPEQMKQYSESFQYHILPPYLQLQPDDEELANSNPIEFINRQEELSVSYTYFKKQAKDAWIAFTNIGAKKKKKGKDEQMGVLFVQNMNYIKKKLDGSEPLEKQMAMYLICQLRSCIKNCEQIKTILPNLISQYVVPEFTSNIMFLRARAMEIFDQYGDLYFDKTILKRAVEGIYFCLTQDKYPLVRLKAASAFHVLLQHEQARLEVKPLFKQILEIYLILLQQYDSQNLVFSLSGIVEHFSIEVGPYACQLMKYLAKYFVKLMKKDKVQSQEDPDYDGQTQLAASGVLNTMRILLQSAIDKDTISKMESDVLEVCDEIFCSDDIDFIEDAISVLRAYTHRMPAITERILFYYVVLIYYVSGIKQVLWPTIAQLPIPDTQKRILNTIKSGCNIESIDSVMLVLRNFIVLNSEILMKLTDPFGVNLLELLFNMVSQIYEKGPDQYDGEVEMNSSSMLMGYLLENNHKKWDDNMLNHIWQVVKFNLTKGRSKVLKAINAQLICLFLWNNVEKTLALAQSNNLLSPMILCILASQPKIKYEHERQRVILGISELLSSSHKHQQIIQYYPKLFNLVIGLVKKNCDYRLNDDCQQNYETESDQQQQGENLNLLDLNNDEPEDIWQQDYQNNYSSKLDQIDQVKYFKESIQKLQNEQNSLYTQLIAVVPTDELLQLDGKMTKAIQLCSNQA